MGFLGKLKDNFSHGGIKVQLQAPASASMNDPTIPVTVSVSASGKQETIERVTVSLIARSYDRGFMQPTSGTVNNSNQEQELTVAEANYAQPFTLMPGQQVQNLQLNLVMNQGANIATQLPEGGIAAKLAGALQGLQSLSEIMNDTSYQYSIRATAKVQGIAFSPSQEQPIQLLKPGQIGGAIQKTIHF